MCTPYTGVPVPGGGLPAQVQQRRRAQAAFSGQPRLPAGLPPREHAPAPEARPAAASEGAAAAK